MAIDGLENDRGRPQRQPAAAVFFRNQRRQESRLRQLLDELRWIGVLIFQSSPILAGIACADLCDRLTQIRPVLAQYERRRCSISHDCTPLSRRMNPLGEPTWQI